jgi:hypothetical protein
LTDVFGVTSGPGFPNLSWGIEGLIDGDGDDFAILLDPGRENYKGRSAGKFDRQALQSAPRLCLRNAESTDSTEESRPRR